MTVLFIITILCAGILFPVTLLANSWFVLLLLSWSGVVFNMELFKQQTSWCAISGSILITIGLSIYYLSLVFGVEGFAQSLLDTTMVLITTGVLALLFNTLKRIRGKYDNIHFTTLFSVGRKLVDNYNNQGH